MNRHVRNVTAQPMSGSLSNSQQITRQAVVNGINPHLLNLLKVETEHVTGLLPARSLLTPARFDVMAKVIYAKHRAMNGGMSWATRAYRSPGTPSTARSAHPSETGIARLSPAAKAQFRAPLSRSFVAATPSM